MSATQRGEFVCPECGSTEAEEVLNVSTVFTIGDPWSAVLQRIACSSCQMVIPAHLGERWGGLSRADAEKEWHSRYRRRGGPEST